MADHAGVLSIYIGATTGGPMTAVNGVRPSAGEGRRKAPPFPPAADEGWATRRAFCREAFANKRIYNYSSLGSGSKPVGTQCLHRRQIIGWECLEDAVWATPIIIPFRFIAVTEVWWL
jgi:hypothetical protein